MKIILHTFFLVLLFSITSFPQYGISGTADSEKMLNPYNRIWEMALKNQQKEFYEEGFNVEDSRALIYRTLLENGYSLIETIHQIWDGANWVNDYRIQYTYNVNNLLIEELSQLYSGGSGWVNSTLDFYSYNVNNNLIEKLSQYWWAGSMWMDSKKLNYNYDLNNNLNEEIYQLWGGLDWKNQSRTTYTYNVNNLLIQELYQLWEYWGHSGWWDYSRFFYTYDENNNLIEKLYQQRMGFTWVDWSKFTYIYDWNNNLVEDLIESFINDSCWVNCRKNFYSYDPNNNLIEKLSQQWKDSIWTDSSKTLNTYNGNNNLIEQFYKVWDGSDWVNYSKGSYTYDGNNNQIEALNQAWNDSSWVNVDRNIYSYIVSDIEQFEGKVITYGLSNNYPNPFNPSTKINYQIPELSFIIIKVFDILGNEIETLVDEEKPAGIYELTWNAANLPSGVYFYQLKAVDPSTGSGQAFIQTRKMILLK